MLYIIIKSKFYNEQLYVVNKCGVFIITIVRSIDFIKSIVSLSNSIQDITADILYSQHLATFPLTGSPINQFPVS